MKRTLTTRAAAGLRSCALLGLLLLGGCAQMKPHFDEILGGRAPARAHPRSEERPRARVERNERNERPAPRPERPDPDRDDNALREGIALYDEGDFNAAIKRLTSSDMIGASTRNRLSALKYTAFSYCVTGRPAPCRQAFERALRLDPSFDLAPGEHGHPQWGPVFTKVKQGTGRDGAREASR